MKSRRKGTLLVEMMVYISLATVALSLVTGLVHRTFHTYSGILRDQKTNLIVARFTRSLRQDLRAAKSVRLNLLPPTVPKEGSDSSMERLVIQSGSDRSIHFLWNQQELCREVWDETRAISREYFPLPTFPRVVIHESTLGGAMLAVTIPWYESFEHPDPTRRAVTKDVLPSLTLELPLPIDSKHIKMAVRGQP